MKIELIVEEKVTRVINFDTADYIESNIADSSWYFKASLETDATSNALFLPV